MCPQTQAVATAVIQAQTSDTEHLEGSDEAPGFEVSFSEHEREAKCTSKTPQ